MVEEGLLDCRSGIYQPASEGWSFIESNHVYGNIQPNPLEIALVDVDSGKTVASVASLSGSSGVRVAGRSYELLPGGSGTQRKVRGGGKHDDSPRYHARSLPYAFDVGAALANRFGIETNTLVTLHVGESIVMMTWLGRLLNKVLAESIRRRGINVIDGSFHLTVESKSVDDVLFLLRQTVDDVTTNNPLARINPERLIDIGPHFRYLSPNEQVKAREDWLDSRFLKKWIERIDNIQIVDASTPTGMDLIALTSSRPQHCHVKAVSHPECLTTDTPGVG